MFDPYLIVYQRLKAIWLDDAGFVAAFPRPGCLLWQDVSDPRARNVASSAGSADYPRFRLDFSGGDVGKGAPKFFIGPNDTGPEYGVPVRLVYGLLLIHEKPGIAQQTPITAAITNPIVVACPKLQLDGAGIAWVANAEFGAWTRKDEKSDVTGGVLRTVERVQLIVNGRPGRSLFSS